MSLRGPLTADQACLHRRFDARVLEPLLFEDADKVLVEQELDSGDMLSSVERDAGRHGDTEARCAEHGAGKHGERDDHGLKFAAVAVRLG